MTHRASCSCHSHSGFLTERGYRTVAQRELELASLDSMGVNPYLDRVVSMSASGHGPEPLWLGSNEQTEQVERFLNGS